MRALHAASARQARFTAGKLSSQEMITHDENKENEVPKGQELKAAGMMARGKDPGLKRDFFGRIISSTDLEGKKVTTTGSVGKARIWVVYHEGFSNAVRKPIALKDLMAGL